MNPEVAPGAADVAAALRQATARLNEAGVESPRLDARVLIAHVLRFAPPELVLRARHVITPHDGRSIDRLIARRARREPVSRILREREFWSLPFRVTPATLDPRPDSETVISAVLDAIGDRRNGPLRLLDLGTGTGCLLLALLSELERASGLGIDSSAAALRVARANARALGLKSRARFRRGCWAEGIRGRFDVILSNPPYISSSELDGLPAEVRFDPIAALDGGPDGLDAYRAILKDLGGLLAPDGVAALEFGAEQAGAVAAIAAGYGLQKAKIVRDLANNDRVIVIRPM
jgi:release factor glutamine methyltransferase